LGPRLFQWGYEEVAGIREVAEAEEVVGPGEAEGAAGKGVEAAEAAEEGNDGDNMEQN
jgi:hypothetical protein